MSENAKEVAEVLSLLGDGVSKGEQKKLQAFVEAYFLNDDKDSCICSDKSSDNDDDKDISLHDAEPEPMDLGSDTGNNTQPGSGADEGDEHEEPGEEPVFIDNPLPDGGANLPPDQCDLLVGHAAEPDHELTRC